VRRHRQHLRHVHDPVLRPAAAAATHDAIAFAYPLHARTEGVDDPRELVAAEFLRAAVHDAAHRQLAAIERARLHAHQHFAGLRLRRRNFAALEDGFVALRDYPV
jgi:hypothetical protein